MMSTRVDLIQAFDSLQTRLNQLRNCFDKKLIQTNLHGFQFYTLKKTSNASNTVQSFQSICLFVLLPMILGMCWQSFLIPKITALAAYRYKKNHANTYNLIVTRLFPTIHQSLFLPTQFVNKLKKN